MIKYYRITAKTPYCGEDNDYYIATDSYDELMRFASDCVDDNANEWYTGNDSNYPEWDDFLGDCFCNIDEITKEEFEMEAFI